jgi:hypothetical protein
MINNDYQTELKTEWIESTDGEYTVQCAHCGRFCGHSKERNSVIVWCDNCETEIELKYLSYKNINNTRDFRAVFHNKENVDNVKKFEERTGLTHSSKFKPKFTNKELKLQEKVSNDRAKMDARCKALA